MPGKIRLQRIGERINLELTELLRREIQDPRLRDIFITDVSVDRELAFASIYVSAVEGHERSGEILEGLKRASGFLRRSLAQRIELRSFPQLRFFWDPTPENADHIERLINSLHEERHDDGK